MQLQYGEVIKVYKDDENGAQLADIQGKLTDRIFYACEILRPKGYNSLPKPEDNVIVLENANSEPIVIGIIEPFDLKLLEGDGMLHTGDKVVISETEEKYNQKTKVKLKNETHEIEIEKGECEMSYDVPLFLPKERIRINEDDEIVIEKGESVPLDEETFEWNPKIRVRMTKDDEIVMEAGESSGGTFIPKNKVTLKTDGEVNIWTELKIRCETPLFEIV